MKLYTVTLEICAEEGQMTDIPDLDWNEILHLEGEEYVSILAFEDHGIVEPEEYLDTDPYGVPYGGCE